MRVSFMNEIANVCEAVGADVDHVRMAIGADRRIGPSFLFPGVGYGGSCFPKDVKALIKFSEEHAYDFRILRAVEAVNEAQKARLVQRVEAHFGSLKGRQIAVWGLSFKPKTDDMREAPAIPIIEGLLARGARVHAFDPEAEKTARRIFGGRIGYAGTAYEALAGADALVVVTEWNEFRRPDFARMKRLMRTPVVFDGRNIYNPASMRALGFTYYSIGRP
jgi:UDPglucose 6-dehydrogenase